MLCRMPLQERCAGAVFTGPGKIADAVRPCRKPGIARVIY
jgi:hypothetical protein